MIAHPTVEQAFFEREAYLAALKEVDEEDKARDETIDSDDLIDREAAYYERQWYYDACEGEDEAAEHFLKTGQFLPLETSFFDERPARPVYLDVR